MTARQLPGAQWGAAGIPVGVVYLAGLMGVTGDLPGAGQSSWVKMGQGRGLAVEQQWGESGECEGTGMLSMEIALKKFKKLILLLIRCFLMLV